MHTFRKKNSDIQAEAWMGTCGQFDQLVADGIAVAGSIEADGSVLIATLWGKTRCPLNDYIYKDPAGDIMLMRPAQMEDYDLVAE